MAYRVLIVDDSPAMRTFVRRVMIVSGFKCEECLEAADGQEALEVLKRERVALILTDLNMPRMNGEELIHRLEEDQSMRSIPVLVVSTDATQNRINRMISMGAKGYVTKPFKPETLREELDRLIGAAHA